MEIPRQFEVLVRRRIPYLSSFIYGLLIFFFAILFVLDLFMLPSSYASEEMKTAYFILFIPETLKTLSGYSVIGLLITIPLYNSARRHRPALLTFYEDHFTIVGNKIDLKIHFIKIEKVFFNDLHTLFGKPRGILQFVIREKRRKSTTFRLKHYEEGEAILAALNFNNKTPIAFYEYDMTDEYNNE